MKLFVVKVQRRLVFGHSRVGDEAIQTSFCTIDRGYRFLDTRLLRHVRFDVFKGLVLFLQRREIGPGIADIERIDGVGGIVQEHFGEAQSDSLVGAGDYIQASGLGRAFLGGLKVSTLVLATTLPARFTCHEWLAPGSVVS